MMSAARLHTFARDARGATLVEFAFVVPVLCVLFVGVLELGYRAYAAAVVQGALLEAARMATVGGMTQAQIDTRVRARLGHFGRRSTVQIDSRNYQEYSDIRSGEPLITDTAPLNQVNSGDCWRDYVVNGSHDTSFAGRAGLGGAEDVVRYEITLTYSRILPAANLFGWSDNETIRMNTMLRNQPFAGRTMVPIACMP
ncbi:pilus assembly protein [Sphingosinicella sp. LHD-64]|uniref:TadE/TadG family type IV pilus assembly protein n=1 Tax=Sphingosinicella sp. LHD-64 TaxID=3072139 RepID=UPI00280D9344|nr:pilus assembly protein [Sphingosinicella sp. LHD-64]MDQ8757095.1 pilus assembly protein [Sphingosinicella sp. LHD-64]